MRRFNIKDILGPQAPKVRVCAVGAMFLAEMSEPQDQLIAAGLCTIVGFEPIAEECARLNALRGPIHRYLPYVIGDGSRRAFHRTNRTMTSSIYPPNAPLLRTFVGLNEVTTVERSEEVETRRLDDLAEVGDVDFLKIDVQGATLDVLRGAQRLLAGVQVVHAEVEFAPMYEGEPLFADVDAHLRGAGFAFHRFAHIASPSIRSPVKGAEFKQGTQQLWADVVYAKDFMRLREVPPPKLLSLAVILHEVYQSYDFCAHVLGAHDAATGSTFAAPYVARHRA